MNIKELLINFLDSYSGNFGLLELSKILSGNIITNDEMINSYVEIFKKLGSSRTYAILKKALDMDLIVQYQNKIYSEKCYQKLMKRKKELSNFHDLFTILEKKYNFQGFFHTTDFDNFIKIYKTKTLGSRNYLIDNNVKFNDNALPDVENKTDEEVKSCVRFYLRPRTPTNYYNEGIKPKCDLQDEDRNAHIKTPVILLFNTNIIDNDTFYFSDGNAGRKYWNAYNRVSSLEKFNWDYIFHDKRPLEYEDIREITRWRCTELLYPNSISTDNIKNIIFRTSIDMNRAIELLGNDGRFKVDSSYFFNHRLYLKEYSYLKNKKTFQISLKYNIGDKLDINKISEYKHKLVFYNDKTKVYENEFIIDINDIKEDTYNYKIHTMTDFNMFQYFIDDTLCMEARIDD